MQLFEHLYSSYCTFRANSQDSPGGCGWVIYEPVGEILWSKLLKEKRDLCGMVAVANFREIRRTIIGRLPRARLKEERCGR